MQASQTPTPAIAPTAFPVQGGAVVGAPIAGTTVAPLLPGVPRTQAEVRALRTARESLSDQLQSAQGRRNEIAEELRTATGVDRTGLEQRLAVTDARLAQLETDLAITGRQLAAAPADLVTSTSVAPTVFEKLNDVNVTAISTVFSIFVLAPMALAVARLIWRRGSFQPAARTPSDTTARLERMEQAIDTIAVEVERISEGQRFVTRLLGEANGGLPTLARAQQAETAPVARIGQ